MSSVADLIERDRDAIVAEFIARVRKLAPPGTSKVELTDQLPDYLDSLARAVRRPKDDPDQGAPAENAREHGEQRERVGYVLRNVTREYRILADCIHERVEKLDPPPPVAELYRLSTHLAAAVESAVETYVAAHRHHADDDRRHLLDLFAQAPGFLAFLRGPTFVFEIANPAYYQTVGHRDILGKPIREALPELDGQGIFELLDRVYATGETYVGRGLALKLQRVPERPPHEALVDFVYQPIADEDGDIVGILVQGTEVTEEKRLERALVASEERFRSLFASLDEGYCLMQMIVENGKTVDYRFLEANEAFEAHTGLHKAVGKTARELVPDLDASWFERYGRVAETGEPLRFESHAPAMGRWFDVYAHRVGPAERREVALVFKNVSAQKQADAERERVLALESAARKTAEESSLLKDEFLATVSHELRTPLSAILGWVQLLRTADLEPTKASRALETIERNARAQAQLIEDLLDVSRILAGKLRLELEIIGPESFVEAAIETVRPTAEKKDLRIVTTIAPDLRVNADASRLQQIVWNLLSNAVKFTPRGGTIRVEASRREQLLDLVVTDSGQGIPPEFLPHVFERFRQARAGGARSHGGLGLGLSIVRQLAEMHGGTASVASEGPGRGATFTISIPLVASVPELAAARARALPRTPELSGARLLVVDDDEDTREVVASLLEVAGASVITASSVAEGMTRLGTEPVDIVFSDIGMPDEDGYAFIAKIRASSGAVARVPVVAITAFARPEDRSRALLAGFDNYIAKPVDPIEMVAVATALLKHRAG